MRILIITQYFWPENFRINDLCSALQERGHQLTILTGKPNYPEGIVFPEFELDPAFYNTYHGAEIIRVPMSPRGTGSKIRLLLNYLSFAISASFIGALRLRKKEFDIIFVYEPSPITVGIPAVVMKKIKKVPIVFWVLDLWPETLRAVGVVKSEILLKLVGKLVSYIYNKCDLILGQSKSFHKGISVYCQDPRKIRYYPSWAEAIFNKNNSDGENKLDQDVSSFKVLFTGNIGEAQDFPALLAAVEIIKQHNQKIRFYIVGDGRMFDWVSQQIDVMKLHDYIVLLGRHPLALIPNFYASADALLVTLKSSDVFAMTIPGKIQSYMAAGKPILAMLNGEGARVVDEAGAGYICDSGDAVGLARNVIAMSKLSDCELNKLGLGAEYYAEKEFNRVKLITQLEEWFAELAIKKA
jgi:colanic acid biosynthesis glycosyl transferase WcaI